MNATGLKQRLLGQLGTIAAILHQGLAFVGLVAVVLLLIRGKPVFPGENPGSSSAIGAIRFDGVVSSLERTEGVDKQKYQALVHYCSDRSKLPQQALLQSGGVHGTSLLVCRLPRADKD